MRLYESNMPATLSQSDSAALGQYMEKYRSFWSHSCAYLARMSPSQLNLSIYSVNSLNIIKCIQ